MLSQPSANSLTPSHKTAGTLGNLGINGRQSIQRTSSVSSLLFARRPSTASSLAGVSSQLSPLHQRVWHRVDPSFSTTSATDLDHCFGGGCSVRRPRDEQRDAGQDLYDFLKASDLEEYYTVLSKHLKNLESKFFQFSNSTLSPTVLDSTNLIRTVQQLKYVTDIELIEMGMSRPEVRRLRKHFEKECPQTTMGKLKKKLARSTSARPTPSRNQRASTEPPGEDRESIFGDSISNGGDSKHITGYRIIPVCELELTNPLGQGEFGRVHQLKAQFF
ncbi:hypothetical protein Aperf_G00000016918 [Anoplocephala perfoliata]